jgi:hypothetical protein
MWTQPQRISIQIETNYSALPPQFATSAYLIIGEFK